jgi:ATP-binding cassette subfamily B protein
VGESVINAGPGRILRALTRVLVGTARRAWLADPGLTAAAVALRLISGAVIAFGLLATVNVFTTLLAAGATPHRVLDSLPALALVTAAYATRGLLDAASGLVESTLTPRVEQQAQDILYTAVIGVDLVAFDDGDFVELIQRAMGVGLNNLRQASSTAGDLLASLVSMLAAVITAALLNPLLAPVVLLSVVPQGWASVRARKIQYISLMNMSARSRRRGITSQLIVSRADAAEIRAFTVQQVLLGEHRRITAGLTTEAISVERRITSIRLTGRTLAGIGAAAAYAVLGGLVYTQALPVALAGTAVLALRTATSAVASTVSAINRLHEASFYLDLYDRCLTDAATRTRRGTAPLPPNSPRTIELTNVSFRYPGQPEPALSDITVTLHAGQVIALVGENGSGKSTLAKILTGLYLADTGTVRWDGTDIAHINPTHLHERIAVVMQNPMQWPLTAADNIRIGRIDRPDPDNTNLHRVSIYSGVDTFVNELPEGWNTVLTSHFHNSRDLSHGQWQRIGVARGLYRDAPLVIADEPTAAMDARAENTVFTHLRNLNTPNSTQQRITVLVTHRLANIRHADLILVLHNGRLTEHGTHHQLMEANGRYSELFTLQAAGYTDINHHSPQRGDGLM